MPGTYPTPLTKLRGDTLALTTAVSYLHAPLDVQQVTLFDPTEDWRLHFNPSIIYAAHYDASASSGSRFIQDQFHRNITGGVDGAGSGTQLDSFNSADYLYLCVSNPNILGLHVDMKSGNSTTSTLTGEYWDGDAWTSLSVTDNTKNGGDQTLNKDGTITWTAVTDWAAAILGGPQGILRDDNTLTKFALSGVLIDENPFSAGDITLTVDTVDATTKFNDGDFVKIDSEIMAIVRVDSSTQLTVVRGVQGTTDAQHAENAELSNVAISQQGGQNPPTKDGFWMRLSVSATLDSDVEIQSLMTRNPNTNRGYFRAGVEYSFSFDRREISGIEALVTANTDTLQVTWVRTMQ